MIRTAQSLVDLQRAFEQRLGLDIIAALLQNLREVVDGLGRLRRVGAERRLPNGERSPQKRLRRRVVGLGEVEDSQIVQRGCDRGIGRARRLFELRDAGLQLRQALLRSLRRG